jgi:hypothetical protein
MAASSARPALIVDLVISRREVAVRLDIPLEMATRHGIPSRVTEAELAELEQNPPAWLTQSRANCTKNARPVWMQLTCIVCGFTEAARPKKWWPDFTYLSCDFHDYDEVPEPGAGLRRHEVDGIGSRFVGIVDS